MNRIFLSIFCFVFQTLPAMSLWTVQSAADFIKDRSGLEPEVALILGPGLSHFSKEIEIETVIPYREISGFPETASGRFILGHIHGVPLIAMQGRLMLNEGYTAQEVVLPIQVMQRLGAQELIITSAVDGINPGYVPGDIVLITDYINLMGDNPLASLGSRFIDMTNPYDLSLIHQVEQAVSLKKGVYAGIKGPCGETRAEAKMLHALGADVVGMSIVQETIAAKQLGMNVLALCIVTSCPNNPEIDNSHLKKAASKNDLIDAQISSLVLALFKNEN